MNTTSTKTRERVKIKGKTAQVILPPSFLDRLDEIAQATLSSRSSVVRGMVADGIARLHRRTQVEAQNAA